MNLRHSRHLFITPAAVALAAAFIAGCGGAHAKVGSPPSTAGGRPAPTGIVQVSHDQFGAHAEPAVAVNPRNPRNLLAASMVFQGRAGGLATYASFDGGLTWQSSGVLPGAAPDNDADVTVTLYPWSHCSFVHCGGQNSPSWTAGGSIRRPFLRPVRTWTARSRPSLTRCMMVWRETP